MRDVADGENSSFAPSGDLDRVGRAVETVAKLCDENRYDCRVQTQSTVELHGTLSVTDLTRFQYFHFLRRSWPIVVLFALFLIVLVPLFALTAIANPESGWRPCLRTS